MRFLDFYRFYLSCAAGALVYFFLWHSIWIMLLAIVVVRAAWFGIDTIIGKIAVDRAFRSHEGEFRRIYGPYGIRIANKAESDSRVKKSLYEVFIADEKKLKKNVEQLEVMDALFNAGMRPEGDEFLLHDLKLKYGKHRMGAR